MTQDGLVKLVTWSFKVTHLCFYEEVILSSGTIVPVGVLCGRAKGRCSTAFRPGSHHLLGMSFCKDCTTKLAGLIETQQAFHGNVTRHPLELIADGMLDDGSANEILTGVYWEDADAEV